MGGFALCHTSRVNSNIPGQASSKGSFIRRSLCRPPRELLKMTPVFRAPYLHVTFSPSNILPALSRCVTALESRHITVNSSGCQTLSSSCSAQDMEVRD